MTNQEQMFYVLLDDGNRVIGQIDTEGYNKLSDDDKKKYQQVLVDKDHLAGWGLYYDTAFWDADKGALSYNQNWPKDQSTTIADLKSSLSDIIKSNNDNQQSNDSLQKQLDEAKKNADETGQIVLTLQKQLAQANGDKANAQKQASQLQAMVLSLQKMVAVSTQSNMSKTNSATKPNQNVSQSNNK